MKHALTLHFLGNQYPCRGIDAACKGNKSICSYACAEFRCKKYSLSLRSDILKMGSWESNHEFLRLQCSWKLYCLYSLHVFNWYFVGAANGGGYSADCDSRIKISIFMLYILNFPYQNPNILTQTIWHAVTIWILFTLDFVKRILQGMWVCGRRRSIYMFCFLALQFFFYSHDRKL